MTDADRIIAAIPIETYIGRYVVLKRKGNNLWGLCPFHGEKTPSFSVSPQKGIYKCFGCGVGGNVITFAKEYNKLSFVEALKLLAEFSGIELSHQPVRRGADDHKKELVELNQWVHKLYQRAYPFSDAERYALSRGILPETQQAFGLGYAPNEPRFLETKLNERYLHEPELLAKSIAHLATLGLTGHNDHDSYNRFRDRWIFPIKNLRGEVIAFGGRLVREKENAGKYVNSPESPLFNKSQTVYRLGEVAQSIRHEGFAIVCEGYLDALGLFEKGLQNAVAPLGTAFTLEQAKQVKRFTDNVVFFFDNDSAGTEAAFKALQTARKANLACKVVHPLTETAKQDPFDLSRTLTEDGLRTLIRDAHEEVYFVAWYFFRHKYNTTELQQKKKALREYYDYIRTLETELERDAFLKRASVELATDIKILQKDFLGTDKKAQEAGAWLQKNKTIQKAVPQTKPKQASKQEKEIIALVLRFPELGDEEMLLEEIPWGSDTSYLLFSFFRDRLKTGTAFAWDNLNSAMQFLPENLSSLLAEIIMDYEDVLNADTELTHEVAKMNLRRLVRTLVLQALDARIKERQSKISELEKAGQDIEELMLDQQQDIDKRIEWRKV
ncbi:MAG: DNA primase [Turneriella sp.]|nr:DNA primase [Turneriella sp.]